MTRLLDLLGSLRLTLVLLVALALLFALGLAIPQRAVLQRELFEQWRQQSPGLVGTLELAGLTDIYRSPLAWLLWGAFFVNLAMVMVRRAPGTFRRVRIDGDVLDPVDAPGFSYRTRLECLGAPLAEARAFFERGGFAVHAQGDRFRAVRNRLTPLATLGFHLSFFLLAAGAGISIATRFVGTVDLGEGEEFTGRLEQYAERVSLPRFGGPPAARFTVESIVPEVQGDVPVGLRVRVRDDTFALHTLEVNRPYRAGGASFVFKNLGIAPALVVTDPDGVERFAGYMRLNVLQGRTESFVLGGMSFTAAFFPDHFDEGGLEGSRSQEMRNPVLRLTMTAPGGQAASAALRPGEAATLGPYTVRFQEWRYWVRLYVRSERGIGVLWFGLALGAVSLAVRLLLFRREYLVGLAGDGEALVIAGKAEYYRALFEDEANGLVRGLKRSLAEGATGSGSGE